MIRIGDFSRLGRVSVRALRHYAAAGLLIPVHVDAGSGYRYYAAAQLVDLARIASLRALGFTLDEIRELQAADLDPALLQAHVAKRRDQTAHAIAEQRARLRRLNALASALKSGAPSVAMRIVPRPVEPVLAYTLRARVPSLGSPVTALFERAESAVARSGRRATASPFLLFHDPSYRERQCDVEVCVPVVAAFPGVRVVSGESSAACVSYTGPYAQTAPLYAEVLRWLEATSSRVAGPVREVYYRFGADQRDYRLPKTVVVARPADYLTELQVPITDAARAT
ncbi:MAG: MerR family transcriptional regulator [Deltaproteobacteria bacterium]|nr:MerR family transcriptional regulator [Nannocystaceae bacterium]